MDSFDKIFSGSDLSENEKRAKKIFGRLLISLKKSNRIKIYSLLSGVATSNIVDNDLVLVFSDSTSYNMLDNKSDLDILNGVLSSLGETLTIKLTVDGKKEFDMEMFKNRLKNEFGKILVIK